MASEKSPEPSHSQLHSRHLLEVTNRYFRFINQISQGECDSPLDEAATLFTHNFKKIFNGTLFTKNREDFVNDLLEIYGNIGPWTVEPVETFVADSGEAVIIRVITEVESLGTHTAIIILRFDANGLIRELNEVFNKVEHTYGFREEIN